MSVIFKTQRKDLIGATIIDVDSRDVEGDLFDLSKITIKLLNGETRCITVDRYEDAYLDIDVVAGKEAFKEFVARENNDELNRCPVCGTVMKRNGIADASLTRTTGGTTVERTITCVRCGHTEPTDARNHKGDDQL